MTIRINCPSCETPNSVDEEMRGEKVRCRKCKEPFTVPAAKKKRADDEAMQEGRKLKTTAASSRKRSDDDEDEDNDRPIRKKAAAKKGFPVLLVLGGVGAILLFVILGAAGLVGFLVLRSQQIAPEPPVAQMAPNIVEEKVEPKKDPEPKKDDEPKKDLDPKKDPDPDPDPKTRPKRKTPDPIPVPVPIPPQGDPLSPELQKVKQATVQVLALLPDGKTLEGSGFFVLPGVVVTNAHVLGMLDPQALPPNSVDVVINPGDPNEIKLGVTYTIDRAADLAILRVSASNLPAPLVFEDQSKLAAKQKVHISGFPFGRKNRKDATVNSTEVTDLKKAPTGALELIQVNGGMSPGSSGGPVVTPAGTVVGVALGAYKDTDAHLAIPIDTVQRMLDGKVGEGTFGKSRLFGDKTIVPYQVTVIDPLDKIKEVRIDIWTGTPTPARLYSYVQPPALTGDGQRMSQLLKRQGTIASTDITVPPAIPAGQVAWVQPVIVLKDNTMQWGIAAAVPMQTVVKIPMKTPPDPPVVVKAKIVLDKKAALTAADPFDQALSQAKKKAHMKEFMVDMQAGKTYVVDLKSTSFDTFLRLGAPTGMQVAFNAGGGANARITYRAIAAGQYRILAISQNGKTGAFHLTVTENP
jgi:predicted Zn finger-like uncharacterized protein